MQARAKGPLFHCVNLTVLPGRFAHFLPGLAHVLVRLLNYIELLLLGWRQEGTDLRPDVIADGFDFLPRFLTDRRDLRLGLLKDRADLRLLLGRKVQGFRHVLERIAPSMMRPVPAEIFRDGILGVGD